MEDLDQREVVLERRRVLKAEHDRYLAGLFRRRYVGGCVSEGDEILVLPQTPEPTAERTKRIPGAFPHGAGYLGARHPTRGEFLQNLAVPGVDLVAIDDY